MLFNSYEFIFLFLPVTFFVYFWLNQKRLVLAGKSWLVCASLFFYSWWNIAFLPLILVSMLVNFVVGSSLSQRTGTKRISDKQLLVGGIVFNLGLLAYFKYSDFFIANVNSLLGADFPLPHVLLPLAISFFTFQQIAYLVDSYRKETREYDFLNYCLFVTFFPQLIAGPIVHHAEIMPQFASRWNLIKKYKNIVLGLSIFGIGLFKKVVIADTFAKWATQGFDVAPTLNLFEAWSTSLSYTFQLYFDFSGYIDMAMGAALLFNIRLPINFNSPYKAVDIQDFWRRWHVTLSRFLRDYLYIPLGGNRKGAGRTYFNLFATFLLGGLWHGASWMFVIWGALHGAALVVHRFWQQLGLRLPKVLAWLLTFNFVNLTWVFFRAPDMSSAFKVIAGMMGLQGVMLPERYLNRYPDLAEYGVEFGGWLDHIGGSHSQLTWAAFSLVFVLSLKNSTAIIDGMTISYRYVVALALMAGFAITYSMYSSTEVFLYFNF